MDDRLNAVYQAAKLHYEYGLTKLQVADSLGVSPASVTRLIRRAGELGLVKISVPSLKEFLKSERDTAARIRSELNVEVITVPASREDPVAQTSLAIALVEWLTANITDGMTVGFSGGRSLPHAIPLLRKKHHNLDVVQLMGGVSSTDGTAQADYITRGFAERFGCRCHVIHSPAILAQGTPFEEMLRNPILSASMKYYDRLDAAVIGIGSYSRENPILTMVGLSEADLNGLTNLDCVGEVCCRFLRRNGEECGTCLTNRVIGVGIPQLIATPKVCSVAVGTHKAEAIIAACRARVVKSVILDTQTASAIAERL